VASRQPAAGATLDSATLGSGSQLEGRIDIKFGLATKKFGETFYTFDH